MLLDIVLSKLRIEAIDADVVLDNIPESAPHHGKAV